jgi:formylglycine-generating enzyme required for sulfatase activity
MACVPGGPAVIGADDQTPAEKPRHVVQVGTFYIDRFEVTNREYDACENAGVCAKRERHQAAYVPFLEPDQPANGIGWSRAHTYCVWAGKRLPSEAEWEKVARGGEEGRLYPWGDEPATCDRAQIQGCAPGTTKAVGSFPAGPYGVHDMAGNGYEWVNDWASECYEGCFGECGKGCAGEEPLGPCGGGPICKGRKKRVLKGGSWFWGADTARGSWRRAEYAESGPHRLSFRCASTRPELATWPPLAKTDPRPAPADPAPPSADELAAFRDVTEDTDVLKLPPCEGPGQVSAGCRDPESYIVSNEQEQHLWQPYLENLGGGYVGVGADQSYSFISAARSRWAWIFDYDPTVVRLHYILRAVVLSAETPQEFVEAFSEPRIQGTREIVKAATQDRPEEVETTDAVLRDVRLTLLARYTQDMRPSPTAKGFGWLRSPDSYRYIRRLHQQGRIQVLKGNLLTDKAMPSIARSARKLGAPIRVYYPSNADDLWAITPRYRENVMSLPFDDRSVVIRTIYRRKGRSGVGLADWHYMVHAGLEEQRKIAHDGWDLVARFLEEGLKTDSEILTVVGLPARTEREKPSGM